MRFRHTAAAEHPEVHRAVRASHQPVQRKDLHLPLVLVRLRGRRHRREFLLLDLARLVPRKPRALRQEVSQTHGRNSRGGGQAVRRQVFQPVSTRRRDFCTSIDRQKLERHPAFRPNAPALGQLQEQANDPEVHGRRLQRISCLDIRFNILKRTNHKTRYII